MSGRVVSVTSYNVATGRATVDVFGVPITDVLNVTGEQLQSGWVVWAEQRGEALGADWVVTDIYSPVGRVWQGTFSGGTTDANGRLAGIAHGAPFTPTKLACFPTVDGGGPQWESCVPTAIGATTFTGRFWSGGAFKVSATVSGGWLIAYL